MKILFVKACVREESRTLKLAHYLLDKLDGEVEEVNLNEEKLLSLDRQRLEKRMALQSAGDYSDAIFDKARQFAGADTIVIAAPYWDLSFPAVLKTYFELICAIGITFDYNEQEMPYSLCRCSRLIYVTTAGGKIVSDEFGFGYAAEDIFRCRDCGPDQGPGARPGGSGSGEDHAGSLQRNRCIYFPGTVGTAPGL